METPARILDEEELWDRILGLNTVINEQEPRILAFKAAQVLVEHAGSGPTILAPGAYRLLNSIANHANDFINKECGNVPDLRLPEYADRGLFSPADVE